MTQTATQTHETSEVLTLTEACQFLKISRQTFYRLLKDEGLRDHGRKMRGQWRFTRRGLLDWIENKEHTA
jgi:excisionase family DNA binding protein